MSYVELLISYMWTRPPIAAASDATSIAARVPRRDTPRAGLLCGKNPVRWRCRTFKMANRAKCRAFGRSKCRNFLRNENPNIQAADNFAGMRKRTSRLPAISPGRPSERPEGREFGREAPLNARQPRQFRRDGPLEAQKATNLAGKPFWKSKTPAFWQGRQSGRSEPRPFGREGKTPNPATGRNPRDGGPERAWK